MTLRELVDLLKAAAQAWVDDYAPSMGAALAYYTMFSMAPLLLIVVSIAGLIFGEAAARGELFDQLVDLIGPAAATAVQGLLGSVSKHSDSVAATIFGFVLIIIGATTVFGELQTALDRIFRAPGRGDAAGGLWKLLRTRLLSSALILGIGFLLMASMVAGTVLAALRKRLHPVVSDWTMIASAAELLASVALTTVLFAMIYKLVPRVRLAWPDVWIGAAVTAVLFTIGKFLIGLYIGQSGIASGFGAAGSLMVVLVWVYYSAQVFLYGAEFTWAYSHRFGSRRIVEDK